MTEDKQKNIVKPPGGIFNELMIRIKLVLRLMGDRRVNTFYKAIPMASLLYLVLPTDLIPLVPIDDALVVWLATYLFVELAPPEVVQEHLDELRRVVQIGWDEAPAEEKPVSNNSDDEIIEAEFDEVKD